MALIENGYKERIIDNKISDYLNIFGALSIEGPCGSGRKYKQCHGK